MTFWLIAAALVAIALAFVLLPLRRRALPPEPSEAAHPTPPGSAKVKWAVGSLAVLLPAVTLGVYLHLGAPSILGSQQMLQARSQHDVNNMLSALEAKLKQSPQDVETLYVLARAYLALQRNSEAQTLLGRAADLAPKEARIWSQYAEAIALNSGGDLQGEPLQLIEQALELDFEDEKALELAGLAAYQRQDWAQAAHFWRRLQKRLPAESEFYQDMVKAIADAQEKSALASGLGERAKLEAPAKKPAPH